MPRRRKGNVIRSAASARAGQAAFASAVFRAAPGEPVSPAAGRVAVGYRRIAAELTRQIRSGHWPVGEKLPPEIELARRWGVTRMTLREALRQLKDEGYISQHRGARTRVISDNPQAAFINSVKSFGEHMRHFARSEPRILSIEEFSPTRQFLKDTGMRSRKSWVRISLLRSVPDLVDPFCYSEVFIRPDFRHVVADLPGSPIIALIEKRFGVRVHSFRQEIAAKSADANLSSRLNLALGAPLLRVRTRFYGADQMLLEYGDSYFPAEYYQVHIELKRSLNGE